MEYVVEEAKKAVEEQEVPVGCAIVQEGRLLASAHNLTNKLKNPLLHAEILALNKVKKEELDRATLYVSIEPCVMCASYIKLFNVKKVVFAANNDRFGGLGSVLDVRTQTDAENREKWYSTEKVDNKECVDILKTFFRTKNPFNLFAN